MELEFYKSCIGITTTTTTTSNHYFSIIIIIITTAILALCFLFRQLHRAYRLRAITFKDVPTTTKKKEGSHDIYCAICLHNLAGGDRYRKLPKCNHCFHVSCIDSWLENRPTCPLCRSHVHHLPSSKHRKSSSPPTNFSYFLLFCRHILKMMGSFVIDGISKAFWRHIN